MAERVVVHQNSKFETVFLIEDMESAAGSQLVAVERIHQLTPYGMLLASLGSCTAMVLHTYAQNHNIKLDEVEIRLDYERIFKEDCQNCEDIEEYKEEITEMISLTGNLSQDETERLLRVSHACPISRMMEKGIPVTSSLESQGEIREEGKGLDGR